MDADLEKVLTSMADVMQKFHERITEQDKVIAELKGKAPEKPKKNEPSEQEKKDFAKRVGNFYS